METADSTSNESLRHGSSRRGGVGRFLLAMVLGEDPGPGGLVSFGTTTGELRWTQTVGSARTVEHARGVVVVGKANGVVRGLRSTDGQEIWCRDGGDPTAGGRGQVVQSGEVIATLTGQAVVALDPATGDERWRTDLALKPENTDPSPDPTIAWWSEGGLIGGSHIWITTGGADGSGSIPLDAATGELVDPDTVVSPTVHTEFGLTQATMGRFTLTVERPFRAGRQEMDLVMNDANDLTKRWSRTLPGHLVEMVARADDTPVVAIVDQTGGSGAVFGPTMLTGYDAVDGTLLWQRDLPVTTRSLFTTDSSLVVTAGPQLIGIDVTTGETQWSVDHGSPGRGRPSRTDGGYQEMTTLLDNDAVGLIVAQRRYRD